MMAGKYLCIALFATLQISLVLCRATGTPDDLVKESVMPTDEAPKAEALKQTGAPGAMDYDIYVTIPNELIEMNEATVSVAAIVGIIFGVIVIIALIIGCIVFFLLRKKKQSTPGHVVSFNNVG